MKKNVKFVAKIVGIIFAVVAVGTYSLYQARNLIRGPVLSFVTPENGGREHSSLVEIRGRAENISYITLNDRQIFVDENGNFKEKLLLSDGYNIMKLRAQDKFGRDKTEIIQLVYKDTSGVKTTLNTTAKIQ
ncbi:hypothetical protein KW783_01725 [Candidatus Parcubacteria bacterium]|nr:hypothetical protein [Candidatus Parcubacteria bacterium]